MRFVLLIAVFSSLACLAQAQPETFAYRSIAGVDADLLSLDVYRVDEAVHGAGPHPVAVYVHGGAWQIGDKAHVQNKATWFGAHGYVLVSVNYRLSPFPSELGNPDRLVFPAHPRDVAAALAYVREHAAAWGGDPSQIGLLGHSAGAHLATLVGVDGALQAGAGLPPGTVRAILSLDTAAYDIPYWLDTHATETARTLYENAFTSDRALWAEASPSTHLDAGDPPILLVHQGNAQRRDVNRRFEAEAEAAGLSMRRFEATGMDHGEINEFLGADDPRSTDYNATVLAFFERHVRGEPIAVEPTERAATPASLHPNPAAARVRLALDPSRTYRAVVVDVLGRRRLRTRLRGDGTLNVRTLAPGRYVVHLTDLRTRERSHHVLTVAR